MYKVVFKLKHSGKISNAKKSEIFWTYYESLETFCIEQKNMKTLAFVKKECAFKIFIKSRNDSNANFQNHKFHILKSYLFF